MTGNQKQISEHYTRQWGSSTAAFLRQNEAKTISTGQLMGWPALFEEIRSQGGRVYDAGCGYGGVAEELHSPNVSYLGVDIHDALDQIPSYPNFEFRKWDMTRPVGETFDYVICRQAAHHTPDPTRTIRVLADSVAPGGVLAYSVYTHKGMIRESCDRALREHIKTLPVEDAMRIAGQFARLGRDLQQAGEVTIREDLPDLGIPAGAYQVQDLVYRFMLKCWYNESWGLEHSTIVNFDWYHPEYAWTFTAEEARRLAEDAGLRVRKVTSIHAQHYVEAVREA